MNLFQQNWEFNSLVLLNCGNISSKLDGIKEFNDAFVIIKYFFMVFKY